MQNQGLSQLMQALQQLTGGQQSTPQVAQSAQQTQQGAQQGQDNPFLDQNMSMPQLIQQGKSSKGKYKLQTQSVVEPQPLRGMHPVESQAVTQAINAGADPGWLSSMSQYLGKNQFLGLCEAFVEQATKGVQGLYSSAIDAWNKQQGSAHQGLNGIQPGDAVYFAPDQSNGNYGHTGVYVGNGQFVGATYNGIRQYNINDWQKATGQKLLGYVAENDKPQVQPVFQNQQPQGLSKPLGSPMTQNHPETGQLIRPPMQQMRKTSVPSSPSHVQGKNPFQNIFGAISKLV